MRLTRFRIRNYKRIEESDWVDVGSVTALVGGNESGKTAMLQALWKLKPGRDHIKLDPQSEFPRRRLTTDYERSDDPWPVADVVFEIDSETKDALVAIDPAFAACSHVVCTSYYDCDPTIEFPDIRLSPLTVDNFVTAIEEIKGQIENADYGQYNIKRIQIQEAREPDEESEGQPEIWKEPREIAEEFRNAALDVSDRYLEQLVSDTTPQQLRAIVEKFCNELTALSKQQWQRSVWQEGLETAQSLRQQPTSEQKLQEARELVWRAIPVFIYFDDYNLLETKIYIPQAINAITAGTIDPKVRAQWALFELAGFDIQEIAKLAYQAPEQGFNDAVKETLFRDVQRRNILAKAAASAITDEFSDWWIQHRHLIDFNVDGEFFQIWVADENYPTPIEFEARSQGFRWFFTFYLVFTAETGNKHANAVLLLDEPGLHLYAPQQEQLLRLFDTLSEHNQVVYSTHSQFMVDSARLDRVRFVEEVENGLTRVSPDTGSIDGKVVFPVQAAFYYHLARLLFLARQVLIVEGETDHLLLQFLSDVLKNDGKIGLPNQFVIAPARGNTSVKPLVTMMIPQRFDIIILLDSDKAGYAAGKQLCKDGLTKSSHVELAYYGDILDKEEPFDLESMLPEDMYAQAVEVTHKIRLPTDLKRAKGDTFSVAVKKHLAAQGIEFDKGQPIQWLINEWRGENQAIPEELLEQAETIFGRIHEVVVGIQQAR